MDLHNLANYLLENETAPKLPTKPSSKQHSSSDKAPKARALSHLANDFKNSKPTRKVQTRL